MTEWSAPRRLTRSTREKLIAGVSGGLAEYFDLDPVVVRLLWIAAAVVTHGMAIAGYVVMMFVMPRETVPVPGDPMSETDPLLDPVPPPDEATIGRRRDRRQRSAAFVLIALGVLFLGGETGMYSWMEWRYIWPFVMIGVGAMLLLRRNGWRR